MVKLPFFSTLRFRVAAAFVLLIALTASMMGLVVDRNNQKNLHHLHEMDGLILARNVSRTLHEGVRAADQDALSDALQELRREPLARYASIFDANGKVLSVWFSRPEEVPASGLKLGDHPMPSIRRLSQNGLPVTEIDVPVVSNRALSAEAQTSRVGTLRLGLSRQALFDMVSHSRRQTARVVLIAILLGALASAVMVRSFFAPITNLIHATRLIGRGEFNGVVANLPVRGELGALATAMTRMTRALRDMKRQLVESNIQLEAKVEERTHELRKALEDLKSLDLLKDEFLSSVSHEFRTPLTSIRAYSEILASFHDEDQATRDEFLQIIIQESDRLSRLVDDILDLAKIEAGGLDWSLESVNIHEIAESSLRSLRPILAERRLSASITRHGEVPFVHGVRDRLVQVMTNLLSNAVKFSNNGDQLEVEIATRDRFVTVAVTDHGVGIDPQDQQVIFDRFRQVGDTLTEKPKGTGLGLPICRNIIMRHGGRIWVESKPGVGSSFHFTLPMDGPERQQLSQSWVGKAQAGRDASPTTIFETG